MMGRVPTLQVSMTTLWQRGRRVVLRGVCVLGARDSESVIGRFRLLQPREGWDWGTWCCMNALPRDIHMWDCKTDKNTHTYTHTHTLSNTHTKYIHTSNISTLNDTHTHTRSNTHTKYIHTSNISTLTHTHTHTHTYSHKHTHTHSHTHTHTH